MQERPELPRTGAALLLVLALVILCLASAAGEVSLFLEASFALCVPTQKLVVVPP